MKGVVMLIRVAMATCFLVSSTTWALSYQAKQQAELASAVGNANVSLEQGLSASEREGKPISAKFEIERRETSTVRL